MKNLEPAIATQPARHSSRERAFIFLIDRLAIGLSRHWLGLFIIIYGAWVLAPFSAPILMKIGADGMARTVYWFYSYFCHQLPERSLFLFGPQTMYSFDQIKAVWPLDGFEGLRGFIGTPQMGYKVAWSDRMISFYGSVWVAGILFAFVRNRLGAISVAAWFFFGVVPVGLDGISHMFNDIVAGTTGTGFRDTNAWLADLTGHIFPQAFYVGDALGSFNSDMRWLTGILFGTLSVWFLFPMVQDAMLEAGRAATAQLERARAAWALPR